MRDDQTDTVGVEKAGTRPIVKHPTTVAQDFLSNGLTPLTAPVGGSPVQDGALPDMDDLFMGSIPPFQLPNDGDAARK